MLYPMNIVTDLLTSYRTCYDPDTTFHHSPIMNSVQSTNTSIEVTYSSNHHVLKLLSKVLNMFTILQYPNKVSIL